MARYWINSKSCCAIICLICYLDCIPKIIEVLMCKYSGKYYRLRGMIIGEEDNKKEDGKEAKVKRPIVRFKFNDVKIVKKVKIITYAEKYREGAFVTVYFNEKNKSDEVWIEEEFDKFSLIAPFIYGTLALLALLANCFI